MFPQFFFAGCQDLFKLGTAKIFEYTAYSYVLVLCQNYRTRCYLPRILMPNWSASFIVSGLSMIMVLPASTTRHLPPFSAKLLMVSGPTHGTSNRISWPGFEVLISV